MKRGQEDVARSESMQCQPTPPGRETCVVCGCTDQAAGWSDRAACWFEESGTWGWVDVWVCAHCIESDVRHGGTIAELQS